MKKIKMVFAKDGSTKIEASGFTGGECLKATESIEKALGSVTSREKKPEAGLAPIKNTIEQ